MTGRLIMIQNRDNREHSKIVTNNEITLSASSTREGTSFLFLLSNGQRVLHQIRLENDNHSHDIIHGNDVPELVAKS